MTKWRSIEKEVEPTIIKYQIVQEEQVMSVREVLQLLITSREFRQFFIEVLKNNPYRAFFLEVKPVNAENIDQAFEWVLIESKELLNLKADKSPFEEYLTGENSVVSFFNLRGDAKLIVPMEISETNNYVHMADFVRKAPTAQADQFWQKVAEEFSTSIDDRTRWLSTSGLGVYWLHVRIDNVPKYYRYQPYKINK